MPKVYVILARWSDGSGYDVLRVLASKTRAERDLAMLKRAMTGYVVEVVESEFDSQDSEDSPL